MGRILILFASHYGQTRKIADHLGMRLRALGHDVDVVDVRYVERGQPVPEDYDAVVLGSRVEVGRHAPRIRWYITEHIDGLRKVPTVFYSVSMSAATAGANLDPGGYMDLMFAELAWKPTRAIALGGGLPYRRYGLLLRFLMKRFSRAARHTTDTSRNHDFTDWNRVDELADEVALLVARRSRVSSL